jgi:predicted transcriptional regulator of viral defense system
MELFMNNFEKILSHLKDNNGITSTKNIIHLGIDKKYLSLLVKKNLIERPTRGVYTLPNTIEDEYYSIISRCKKCIFSHDTALFLHGLSDRSPLSFSITLQNGYNSQYLKGLFVDIFYVRKEVHKLGKIEILSPNGKNIYIYDLERTICDVIRSKKRMEIQIFSDALKFYSKRKDKNLNKLMQYAKILKVDEKIRNYMEVLL